MSDFFSRLELDLRAAADRAPRRAGWAPRASGIAVAVAVAAAVVVALAVPAVLLLSNGADERSGDRPDVTLPAVGTVIKKGEGKPPRQADSTVVAVGTAPLAGPWQLETYRGKGLRDPETGEVYEPAGLRCLQIVTPAAPFYTSLASGQCGEFPRTPGFSRIQKSVPAEGRRADGTRLRAREVLVYGRVPERAAAVVVTTAGGVRLETKPQPGPAGVRGDFYLIPVQPGLGAARINWVDESGREGSRGIALLPPISPLR